MKLGDIQNRVCKLEEILTHLAKWTNFDLTKFTTGTTSGGLKERESLDSCHGHGHVENVRTDRHRDSFQDLGGLVVVDVNDILNAPSSPPYLRGVGMQPPPSPPPPPPPPQRGKDKDPDINESTSIQHFGTDDNIHQGVIDSDNENDQDALDVEIGPVYKIEVVDDTDTDTDTNDNENDGHETAMASCPTNLRCSSNPRDDGEKVDLQLDDPSFPPPNEVETGESISIDEPGQDSQESESDVKLKGRKRRRISYVSPVKENVIVLSANSSSLPSPYVSMERLTSAQLIPFGMGVQGPQASHTEREKRHQTITSRLKIKGGIKLRQKCPHCTYTASGIQLLNQHIRTKHEIVTKDLPSNSMPQMKLNAHVKNTHSGTKPHQCQCYFCEYKTNFYQRLNNHMRKHTDEKPFKCPTCPFTTSSYTTLVTHVRAIHPADTTGRNVKCPGCPSFFKREQDFNEHAMLHKGEVPPHSLILRMMRKEKDEINSKMFMIAHNIVKLHNHKCLHCDFTAKRKIHLIQHIQSQHVTQDVVPLKCPKAKCPTILQGEVSLYHHVRSHNLEKSFLCHMCPFATNEECKLNKHIDRNVHFEIKCLKCYFCGDKFYTEYSLLMHLRLHTDERPYKCSESKCHFAAATSSSLDNHLGSIHNGGTSNKVQKFILRSYMYKARDTANYRERRRKVRRFAFNCGKCEYGTGHKGNFSRHLKLCLGEKSSCPGKTGKVSERVASTSLKALGNDNGQCVKDPLIKVN